MSQNDYAQQLADSKDFFERSTRVLEEADSAFRPQAEMMTVAQQVCHVAQTLIWFVQGASRPEGFDLNFAEHGKELAAITSLTAARKWVTEGYAQAIDFATSRTPEQLAAPLPAGPVMGGQPVGNIFWAMIEHAAHHRGALTVYSRQLGKTPAMPYMG